MDSRVSSAISKRVKKPRCYATQSLLDFPARRSLAGAKPRGECESNRYAGEKTMPVRPLAESDIPQVADLYWTVLRERKGSPPPIVAAFLLELYFKNLWLDPEIPSLVYDEKGKIDSWAWFPVKCAIEGNRSALPMGGILRSTRNFGRHWLVCTCYEPTWRGRRIYRRRIRPTIRRAHYWSGSVSRPFWPTACTGCGCSVRRAA